MKSSVRILALAPVVVLARLAPLPIAVRPDSARSTVVAAGAGLSFPTGLAVGQDASVYVGNCGNCAGTGTVVRFGG